MMTTNEMTVFPDELDELTVRRLNINMDEVKQFKDTLLYDTFAGRISNIVTDWKGIPTMKFFLDDRKSGKCLIEEKYAAWVDAGMISLMELSVHFCMSTKPGSSRRPVQQSLF